MSRESYKAIERAKKIGAMSMAEQRAYLESEKRHEPESDSADCAPRTGSVAHPGVWCCERRGQCKWKCYALEAAGLQWGTPDQVTPEWLKWHKRECGGRLVQLVPPNNRI